MRNIALTLMYDGTAYHGWQMQKRDVTVAETLEKAIGNPLYHWSHLELKRYFGYEGHLTGANAKSVWDHCQAVIGDGLHVRGILKQSNVTLVCTTCLLYTSDAADD